MALISSVASVVTPTYFGTLTPPLVGSSAVQITAVTVNGTNRLTGGTLTLIAGTTPASAATAIAARIGSGGYSATANVPTSGTVYIFASPNAPIATLTTTANSVSNGTITAPAAGTTPLVISAVTVNGSNILLGTLNIAPGTSATTVASLINAAIDTTNYTPSFSGSTVTLVRNDSAAITSVAVTAISSSGTLTAVAPGAVPMYISQVQINGSGNALTTPLAFSPGTTASAVASAIASNIGSGYSATSSGSLVTIISTTNAQITSVTTNATNAYSATLNVGNWTGAPSAGNGTISGITVGGIAVVGGPFNSTTPSALASAVAAGINAGGASFSPGGAPSATQYSAIASGNTVTVYSPLSGSAPAAISYGFSMPPNSPGPTTHASATLSIPPAEGALVPNATISSITIGGSASCPAYPSSASANLLSTNIGPDASGATLIADFVGKDKAGDNYTMAVNTVTRIVTFTENASGTAYTSLNGCLLNVAYGGAGTHTETPFALGNFANTSTNPSGGSFGGGGAVSLLPGPNNPTVPVTTATNAAAPYTMAPATGLGSYTLTGATNNTPANVAGTPNLGAYAMAPTPNLGGAYNLGPLANNPAATLIATPNLGAYPVTTTPNLNGAFSLTPAANNPPVPVVTTPNLGGYTITPNFPVTFTYLVPTAINNVVANLSPLPNLGGFTTSTTNNSAVTFLPAPTFSNPAAAFVGTGALGSYSIATATGLTGGPFSLSGAPFNPVVAMTATFGLGAYNAAPVTGLGGAYAPVSAANNPTVNLSPTAGLGTYTFPASISAAAGYIGTTSVPFTGSALSNLPNRSSVGVFQRVDIVPATPTYTVSATRTDCVGGTTCTYTEELTNFSNWYSFYRTRMQLMKTGAGLSFTGLGSGYRVGFITIHPATAPYVPIADFNSAQKSLWFTDFYSTDPNAPDPDHAGAPRQTPLRSAMSIAGRIFAGQKPAPATDDPMQYSCQQNFLLMTTDGYWLEDDETAVKELNGSRVNNQDSSAATPFKDGDAASGATSCPLGAGNVACLANTCQGNTNDQTSFSSCNTLADVAYYYYTTDLRDAALSNGSFNSCLGAPDSFGNTFDTCADNVPTTATDNNVKQHMTTFTLGLGIDGFLNFSQDYATNSSGDFAGIKAGTVAWPQVKFNDVTGVDDLWHAAVNGHGSYFSARDPKTLRSGISSALSSVSARIGAGAAAATSNLQPVAGDNYAFVGSYTTQLWTGNLEARAIDTQAGTVGDQALWCVNDTAAGSATTACSGGLKTQISGNSDSRNIFFFQSGGTNNLASFTWSNLPAAQQALFDPTQLNQYGALSAASKTQAGSSANATNLINWLRGQTDHEELASNTPVNQVFRARQGALGDVIGSQPVYVRGAHFQYGDPGYGAFLTAQSSRLATVYLGVNDGMLHAIDATTTGTGGKERWAYVPSQVMSNMTTLADDSYATLHKFFVDATPTIADICVSSCNAASAVWKTILIGGFNSGGRGYYALDITDPATPVGLWELTTSSVGLTPNQAVGYSFGNPIITKDNTGNWVVLLTSGYNNVSPGDGQGHLYVLNAYSGTVSKVIDLDASVGGPSGNVGSVANPSGFARVSGFNTDVVHNNQVTLLYGGDLLGNLWRIDFNAASTPAVKIAELTDASHVAQPITTKPELTLVGALRLVLLGTGKFLEQNDKTSAQTQTVYGIYDKYDALVAASDPAATLVDPHDTATSTMVAQILSCTLDATTSDGTSARNLSANPVASFSNRGWFVDLCGATTVFAGERVNVDPLLSQAVLKVASNIPQSGTCTTGGQSFINYFKFDTGGATALTGTNVGLGSISFGTKLVVGITENVLASGQHVILVTGSDTPTPKTLPSDLGQNGGAGVVQGRRSSWRELVQ